MGIAGFLDSAIATVAPVWAKRRAVARMSLDAMSIRRTLDAGKIDRLTRSWDARASSGEVSEISEVKYARQRAWDMYENSGHARKLIRALLSHSIGTGLIPESLAVDRMERADTAFRVRSKKIWRYFVKDSSFYAKLKMGLTEVGLSGEVLIRKKYQPVTNQRFYSPIDIELIAAERLVEDSILPNSSLGGRIGLDRDHIVYRGIEFNGEGEVVAYHLYRHHPNDPRLFVRDWLTTDRIPASEIIHWFWPDRPDSIRGKSWFAPVLLDIRDVKDYKEDEMQAALAGACVTLAIMRKYPGTSGLTLATEAGEDSTDEAGNSLARMQPGMLLNLGVDDKIEGFNPQRPNVDAVAFLTMLLRGIACGVPGIKSSTITGDYRESSFSSERSADNDCWREIEMVQDWIAEQVCQPVWDLVIETAVLAGRFDDALDMRVFNRADFANRKRDYLDAIWSGPVAKSINPVDDAEASIKEINANLSSPQIECAARGLNWEENLEANAKYKSRIKELEKQYDISFLPAETEAMLQGWLSGGDKKDDKADSTEPADKPKDAKSNGVAKNGAAKPPAAIVAGKKRWYVGPEGEDLSSRLER